MEFRFTIALIYDFDGTLAPGNMQEYDFIPAVGKSNKEFWTEANTLAEEQDADMVLTYMARMIQEAKSKGLSLRREAFQDSGRRVTLFAGVKEWFSRINAYGAGRGIRILHYINSSGLKEIIEGTEIAHEFRKIYACSFLYDVDGIAYWPAVAVNYTNKTQFIFKINKGVESVFDSKLVNRYIPENERPVPFKHMIYVGDGTTDIPCMRLVKNSGGHSIAVYNPDRKGASKEMASLIHDNRVSHVCPADYTEGSEMDILVKTIIDTIALEPLEGGRDHACRESLPRTAGAPGPGRRIARVDRRGAPASYCGRRRGRRAARLRLHPLCRIPGPLSRGGGLRGVLCRERTSATPAAARKGRRAIACPQDLHGLAQLLSDDRPFRRAGTPRTAPFGLDGRGVGPAGGVGAALFRRGQIRPLRPGGRIPALAAGRPAGSCGISHPAPAAPQPLPRGELPAPGRTQPQPLPL